MNWLQKIVARKQQAKQENAALWEQIKATPEQVSTVQNHPYMSRTAAERYDRLPGQLTSSMADEIIREWS